MLELRGYFDDSGTHADSEAVTVAGYISTAEQWNLFEHEWQSALDEWGIEYFHMADFANGAKPYDNWTDTEKRHRFARLVNIINRHAIASVGMCIPKKSYDQIFPKDAKRFVGGAYGLAAAMCFVDAGRILKDGYPSARIAYIFEAGTVGSSEVAKVFNWNYTDREQRPKLKLLSLKFEGKKFLPLQAADILAYELYRITPHEIGLPTKHGPRIENVGMLSKVGLKAWGRVDDEELFNWANIVTTAVNIHGQSRRPRRNV